MKRKDLIIGAFYGYNFNTLKPWVMSINATKFEGDKVLIGIDASKETVKDIEREGFKVLSVASIPNMPVHVSRFIHIHEYLCAHIKDYRYVITTDVKDVIFQYNPIDWLQKNLYGGEHLVAGSEALTYENEPWGNDNLMQAFGPYIHGKFKSKIIYNVGTLAGTSDVIKDLCLNLVLMATNRPIPIVDQAVFNVLLNMEPYISITKFVDQRSGWACQAGTVADPTKINQFRPLLLEEEPIFEDHMVRIGGGEKKGEPFCIVHQYDRVPEWKSYFSEHYGQQDETQFFTYRT